MIMAGCGPSTAPGRIETFNFRQGTDGIEMEFVEGMPPKQLFIGSDFSIGIKASNKGAYSVVDRSEIKISVPDVSAFSFSGGNTKPMYLDGKSLYMKEGAQDVITFPAKTLCFPGYDGTKASIVRNYTAKVKATACYYYETTANADLCIDTRKYLREASEKPVCLMKDVSLSGGQGGPVGVISISPQIIPMSDKETTVQISISIKKLKGNEVTIYNPEVSGCTGAEAAELQNEVEVYAEMGGEELACEPTIIELKERDAVGTICKKKVNPNMGAFTTPLSISMRYYVQQTKIKDITVEPPPGNIDCPALRGAAKGTTTSGGGETDRCAAAHAGFSCRTVECDDGEAIDACATRLGCFRGLCSGGTTNICCP